MVFLYFVEIFLFYVWLLPFFAFKSTKKDIRRELFIKSIFGFVRESYCNFFKKVV